MPPCLLPKDHSTAEISFLFGVASAVVLPLRPCLDACISTSIHMCWSGMECNLVQFHSNPPQHMWIEMNTCASKQGLNACSSMQYIIELAYCSFMPRMYELMALAHHCFLSPSMQMFAWMQSLLFLVSLYYLLQCNYIVRTIL